jgi:TPR repeat protein
LAATVQPVNGVKNQRRHLFVAMAAAVAICAAGAGAQVPPRTLNPYVLIDTGPVQVPASCPCISSPFTVPATRPGWGYGDGPGAPSENAEPSEAARKRQAEQDAEDRATLPLRMEDALAGNGNASLRIAMDLMNGTPGPRENEQAARWLYLAASQNHHDAFIRLGYIYSRGIGVPEDAATAAYWYRAAARHGDKNAMVAVGLLYAAGRGVKQDWSAGARWWTQAAEAGLPIASRFLGDAYACGLGVEQDPERAVAAYRRAADAGETSSSVQLGHMYRSGCVRGEDQIMATAYQKAADRGDPEAQVALSALFFDGRGVEQDFYRAYTWARLAERRLTPGELRESARTHATKAARQLSAFLIADAERFVDGVIRMGSTPMR